MSTTAIFIGIIAIAKAVPIVSDWLNKFYDMWVSHQISENQRDEASLNQQRDALVKAISKAQTKEERRALSSTLHALVNGKL
jgi:hypothetical protein